MWDNLIEQAHGALSVVVLALITSLAGIVIAFIYSARDKALEWLKSKTTESQRNTLWKIAQEAFAHAEAAGLPEKGKEKLNYALDYAAKRLQDVGIDVTTAEIKAAIEKACLEHNKAKPIEIKVD
jgi:LL-H family phage holin